MTRLVLQVTVLPLDQLPSRSALTNPTHPPMFQTRPGKVGIIGKVGRIGKVGKFGKVGKVGKLRKIRKVGKEEK